ncbi:hypothetical protein BGZ75_008832 [Mortierella antarctica]|nr:hypothetical protein BGZ75_008832 [Mortierella antarctica]
MTSNTPRNTATTAAFPPFINLLNGIMTNLTSAREDSKTLKLIMGSIEASVNSSRRVFNSIGGTFPVTDASLLIYLNKSLQDLQPLVRTIVSCSGTSGADCVGANQLYKSYVASALARRLALGSSSSLQQVETDLKAISADIDNILATGQTSKLASSGQALNRLIGKTMGDTTKYGDISNYLVLVYESAKEALRCNGYDTSLFGDECSRYAYRLSGVLLDFIPFIRTKINLIPIVGTLISSALDTELTRLEAASRINALNVTCETASMLNATLTLINATAPTGTNLIRDYLNRVLSLTLVPPECGCQGQARCSGLFKITRMVTNSLLSSLGDLGFFGSSLRDALTPPLNTLLNGLNAGALLALQASYEALTAIKINLQSMWGWSTISGPFQAMVDLLQRTIECLQANP